MFRLRRVAKAAALNDDAVIVRHSLFKIPHRCNSIDFRVVIHLTSGSTTLNCTKCAFMWWLHARNERLTFDLKFTDMHAECVRQRKATKPLHLWEYRDQVKQVVAFYTVYTPRSFHPNRLTKIRSPSAIGCMKCIAWFIADSKSSMRSSVYEMHAFFF